MVKLIGAYTLSECLEAMAENVAAYEALGRRNLIFCEDRLTLVAERALLRKQGGSFLSEITTFARFLKTDGKVLSRQGSVMAVGNLISRLQAEGRLRCFTRVGGGINAAKCIYEQIAQFAASELTPDSLLESAEYLKDDALKNKIHDLSLLYLEYDRFLKKNGYLDEGNYLTLLPSALKAEPNIEHTNIFFLCYSSFTAQAAKTIQAAISCAANVVGIFVNGPEEIYTGSAYQRFLKAAKEVGKPFVVNAGTPLIGEAEVLRKGLYRPEKPQKRQQTDRVSVYLAQDMAAEAEHIAVQIRRKLMEDESLKYSDFSVLVPDSKSYALSIKKAFGEYAIPYSTDERISLIRHPLAKYLLLTLEAVGSKCLPSAVDGVLASPFFGDGDSYRNYLLKYGNLRGGALKPIREDCKGYDTEKLKAQQGELKALLARFPMEATGRGYAAALRELLASEKVQNTLQALEQGETDASVRSYLEQILPALEALTKELELLVGGETMKVKDFTALVKDGLEATEISPTPIKVDAVFVGDLVDSRIERTRVLFAAGLTDGVPKASNDANLVTDKDKESLLEVKAALEPMVTEVNLRSRENACLNLCTFTDDLYLSYPSPGGEGTASDLLFYTKQLFCGRDGEDLPVKREFSVDELEYLCSAPAPAVRKMVVEMDGYQSGKTSSRSAYSTLLSALREKGIVTDESKWKEDKRYAPLSPALLFVGDALSPTKIEGFYSCPYKNFLQNGLGVREREETTVLVTDTGSFIHALLEKTAGKAEEYPTEAQFAAFARAVGEELLKAPTFAALKDTAAGAYSFDNLLKEGVTVACAVYRQLAGSSYTVEAVEKSVKTDYFQGKIDRVDVSGDYVRIVDYKTESLNDKPTAYYVGQKMQMQLYMSAVCGERVPAGVFYFPASVSYSESVEGKFRMQGFFNRDEEAVLRGDKELLATGKSEFFDAKIGKKPAENSMDGETFAYFIEYAKLLAENAREEVKSGYIEPTPYGSVCSYCKFGGACGFCRGDKSTPRQEPSIKAEEIAEIVKREEGEDDNG